MSRPKPAVVQIGDELFDLERASTKDVTIIHRVTGERRTIPHHELANLVTRDPHRSPRLLDTLPAHVIAAAQATAIDVEEVITGIGRNGTRRSEYNPASTSQEQRVSRKLTEMRYAGRGMARSSFFHKMKLYQRDGLIGLVDGRALRQHHTQVERLDGRVLDALITVIDNQKDRATGTTSRIIAEATAAITAQFGPIPLPSQSSWYTLIDTLGAGKYTTKSAKTRRSLGNRPDRPFAKVSALLPGASVQIDTNTMDVEVRRADGTRVRPLLSVMTDIYSRSIIAFTIRVSGTKSIDHMMLLAQAVTPRENRPDRHAWRSFLRQNRPDLDLLDTDEYNAKVADAPFIRPINISTDRGSDYLGATFKSAARQLGCSIVLSAPYTPTGKPHVERQFSSINSLFTQHLPGYIGRSAEHTGRKDPVEELLTVEELRELFEDWVVGVWQTRPHSGLRDPISGRLISPNEKAARASLTVEQLRAALTREDYIGMLESAFRGIGSTGVQVNNRHYDSDLLHPLKGTKSPHPRNGGKWEVKLDPYNPTCVWVVGRDDEFIECWERGTEARLYEPDFAPIEDDYRALTAHIDAELAGTPHPSPTALPELVLPANDEDDEDDDGLLPDFDF